jgi:hypothetical protein
MCDNKYPYLDDNVLNNHDTQGRKATVSLKF